MDAAGDSQSNPSGGGGAATERITNGGFADGSSWSPGAGWTIAAGVASNSGTLTRLVQSPFAGGKINNGLPFTLRVDLTNAFGDTVNFLGLAVDNTTIAQVLGLSSAPGPGTVTINSTATADIFGFAVVNGDGDAYSVDNISLIA